MNKELKADKARLEEKFKSSGINVNCVPRDKEWAAINVASLSDTFLTHIKAIGIMFFRK
jgi:hypothetical protein